MADHVFICYAREDQDFVLKLAANLKERGVPVWVDQWDIPPAVDWDQSIDDALYGCAQFLIVLSSEAVESKEVRAEWHIALNEDKTILPVLYKECRVPRQLGLIQHIDFTSRDPDDSEGVGEILRALKITEVVSTEIKAKEDKIAEPPVEAVIPERKSGEYRQKAHKARKINRIMVLGVLIGVVLVIAVIVVLWYHERPKPATLTNSIGMEFVLIPAGRFIMGSREGEERPAHRVIISQPFYIDKNEVTQAQWDEVMEVNPSHFKGDPNRPVENVSWDDVQKFIDKLNEIEPDKKYRLPTEAEWEYACRAGSESTFSFGDDISQLGRYAWYVANSGGQTHPVGQLKPNSWGLYDKHGNVWEWVQDWFGEYSGGTTKDPHGPSKGNRRVLRGGSFSQAEYLARCASRVGSDPDGGLGDVGFRVVHSP